MVAAFKNPEVEKRSPFEENIPPNLWDFTEENSKLRSITQD